MEPLVITRLGTTAVAGKAVGGTAGQLSVLWSVCERRHMPGGGEKKRLLKDRQGPAVHGTGSSPGPSLSEGGTATGDRHRDNRVRRHGEAAEGTQKVTG